MGYVKIPLSRVLIIIVIIVILLYIFSGRGGGPRWRVESGKNNHPAWGDSKYNYSQML